MSEENKVGEYVRTKEGQIDIVIEQSTDKEVNSLILRCKDHKFWLKDILKHSFDIIDLIEENDWVNGQHVKEVKNGYVMVGNGIDGFQIWEEDIRTIVTKEQFKSVEYEVK